MFNLQIYNAKKHPLSDQDILRIVEIECHPLVEKWVYEYEKQDFEEELSDYKKFFQDLPRNEKVDAIIAKYDGNIVGFLCIWRLGVYMEHVASIGISIHPSYWDKGAATQLIKFGLELSKTKGLKRLEIETLSNNVSMRRVAEKLGFNLESVRKNRIQKNGSYHDEAVYFMLL